MLWMQAARARVFPVRDAQGGLPELRRESGAGAVGGRKEPSDEERRSGPSAARPCASSAPIRGRPACASSPRRPLSTSERSQAASRPRSPALPHPHASAAARTSLRIPHVPRRRSRPVSRPWAPTRAGPHPQILLRSPDLKARLEALLRSLPILPVGEAEARAAARIRADLETAGKPISEPRPPAGPARRSRPRWSRACPCSS